MLYYNGVGVDKDVQRAEELQRIAVATASEIEPLKTVGEEKDGKLILSIAILVVAGAALFTILKAWRRRSSRL
jgi:hypothetical protein